MRPCIQCKNSKKCDIEKFVKDNIKFGPFELDSRLRQYTSVAYITKATEVEVELECLRFWHK